MKPLQISLPSCCCPFDNVNGLRTTNGVERLNQEIRRRERVIRIFPNEASTTRLMGALLMEQREKWETGRKYFEMELYYQSVRGKDDASNQAA